MQYGKAEASERGRVCAYGQAKKSGERHLRFNLHLAPSPLYPQTELPTMASFFGLGPTAKISIKLNGQKDGADAPLKMIKGDSERGLDDQKL